MRNKIKRVGLVGLYSKLPDGSPAPVGEVLENIRRGITLAADLIAAGYAPYCPWLDFQYWLLKPELMLEDVHNCDLAWYEVCDAILLKDPSDKIPPNSQVNNELAHAEARDIPIFYTLKELIDYDKGLN